MFCSNCGKIVPDGSKFCPGCGTSFASAPAGSQVNADVNPIPEAPVYEAPVTETPIPEVNYSASKASAAPAAAAEPKNKKKLIMLLACIGGGVLVVAAIVVVLFLFVFRTKTVDLNLNDYVTLEAEGYDGYGDVYVSLDYERMQADYADAKLKWKGNVYPVDYNPVEALEWTAWISDAYLYDMSNGDVITVDIDLSGVYESNLNIIYDPDYTYTVEGLDPIVELNPFDYFHCDITGCEGATECDYGFSDEVIEQYDILGLLWPDYECEDSLWELKNGDVITFTIDDTDNEFYAEYYGVKLTAASYTYTVADLPMGDHYVTDENEIPSEYVPGLSEDLCEWVEEDWADKGLTCNCELAGWAFGGEKLEGSDSWDDNILFVIIKSNLIGNDGELMETYFAGWMTDIEYDADTQTYSFYEDSYSYCSAMSGSSSDNYTYFENGDWTYTVYGLAGQQDVVDWVNDYVDGDFVLSWHMN